MTRFAPLAALILGFGALALPAVADEMIDPMTLTCADLMAMDSDGMMAAGTVLKEAMKDDEKMMSMSDDEVMKAAEEACKMHGDASVMDAIHM